MTLKPCSAVVPDWPHQAQAYSGGYLRARLQGHEGRASSAIFS